MAQTEQSFDQVIGGGDLSLKTAAASDLSGQQYYGCKLDSDGHTVIAAAGDALFILQDKPIGDRVGSYRVLGASYAHFGGTVTPGQYVTSDAYGKIVAATPGSANTGTGAITGSNILGFCVIGGLVDETGTVFLCPGGELPGTAA